MKIALCLSGGLRNFKDTYHTFSKFLLEKHDVDVFFYGLENKEGKEKNIQDLIKLYNPKKFEVNDEQFYSNIICNYDIKSSFYGFYNVFKCNQLRNEYEVEENIEYDLVIKSRTDCFWFRDLSEEELLNAKEKILTPVEWSFKIVNSFALSDVYAIGNSKMMNEYSNLFNRIDEYCQNIKFHPESLCGYHIMVNKIPYLEVNRSVIFEYPCERTEKYIYPYKYAKLFTDIYADIKDEGMYLEKSSHIRLSY